MPGHGHGCNKFAKRTEIAIRTMCRRNEAVMRRIAHATLCACLFAVSAFPQQPAAPQRGEGGRGRGGRGQQAPPVVSPEVSADRRITFRILAPQAQSVRMTASDIPGLGQAAVLTKSENGIWSTTVGPVEPGAY